MASPLPRVTTGFPDNGRDPARAVSVAAAVRRSAGARRAHAFGGRTLPKGVNRAVNPARTSPRDITELRTGRSTASGDAAALSQPLRERAFSYGPPAGHLALRPGAWP